MRAATVLLVLLAGCQSSTLYEWGHYEDSVYRLGVENQALDIESEIATLEEDLEHAREKGRPLPPGFHAHLGYLLYLAGDVENARGHFSAESELFPASAVFVEGTLARMGW